MSSMIKINYMDRFDYMGKTMLKTGSNEGQFEGMLNKFKAAKKLGISRTALDGWLGKPEIEMLLLPEKIEVNNSYVYYFREDVISIWAKLLPKKRGGGGKRLDIPTYEKIRKAVESL